MVAEVAASGNHALGGLPAIRTPESRRRAGGPDQPPGVADESAPARYRGVSRFNPAIRGNAKRDNVGAIDRLRRPRQRAPHRLLSRQPGPAEYRPAAL